MSGNERSKNIPKAAKKIVLGNSLSNQNLPPLDVSFTGSSEMSVLSL